MASHFVVSSFNINGFNVNLLLKEPRRYIRDDWLVKRRLHQAKGILLVVN